MNRSIVHRPLPEERELATLLVDIERLRAVLEARQTERAELESTLMHFSTQVKSRIGEMKEEIRSIRAKLEETRHLTWRLKSEPDAEPEKIEKQVADEFADDFDIDPEAFASSGQERPPGGSFVRKGNVSKDGSNELMRLYRELAKRYHPDLAKSPGERLRKTDLMFRINIAFRDRDLATLRSMALEVDLEEPVNFVVLLQRRLAWARNEAVRLRREIVAADRRLESLATSESFKLWQSSLESDTVLEDLEHRTRARLERERKRLREAEAQYARVSVRRRVMLRRAAAREEPAPAATAGSD